MVRALIPLASGFEDIEAITVIDVLRRGGVEVVTASIHSDNLVTSAHGVELRADALFGEVAGEDFDAIVLPGGGMGTENLRDSMAVIERLRRQRDRGRLIAAICAAPLVLEDAGVLDEDQHVTCYPTCAEEISHPWIDQPVIVHNGIITGQAPGTAMLFALVVLKELVGGEVAQGVAHGMVTDVLG